ncbi:hypothetical protein UFOVP449_20 [uncultured Caudovirales phage]|uniref:Uncharacterized protein n=1 Tax=uncultured Caudovirales phage TaxID=2100421 RepID=A0A6J5MAE6_9CAUD|nr:hypothetical protein UFOVP449_20 [uncultured Caudovirales phage]
MNQRNEIGQRTGYWESYHDNGNLNEKEYYARM